MILQLLLASSDKFITRKINESLISTKINITTTTNCNDLLNNLLEKKFDLLILDNSLKDIDHFDVLPILKKAKPHLPVIFISNNTEYPINKQIASSGVIARLTKPSEQEQHDRLFFKYIHEIVNHYLTKNTNFNMDYNCND